jgi:tetratricopeptide (TPR) repeat protein
MVTPFEDVISSVNGRLKAAAVIRLIGFRPDGLVRVGTRIKGYCPVHRGETFKSLQLDEQNNTAQCIVKDCRAYEPCSLVELYALSKGIAPLAGALELAKEFQMELGANELRGLAAHYLAEANQAIEDGRTQDALAALEVVRSADPDNLEALQLQAPMLEAVGRLPEAAGAYARCAQLQRVDDPMVACTLVEEEVLRLCPDDPAYLLLLSELQQNLFPTEKRWLETRRRAAESFLAAGDETSALAAIEVLRAPLGDDPAFLAMHAELLERAGKQDEAGDAWRKAARLHERGGRLAEALAVLEKLLQSNAGDEALRERIATLRADQGDLPKFRQEMKSLARLATNRGDEDRAEGLLHAIVERIADDAEALEGLAACAAKRGDSSSQVDYLLRLAQDAATKKDHDRLKAQLATILAVPPKEAQQLEETALLLLSVGDQGRALPLLTEAIVLQIVMEEQGAVKGLLRRILQLAPADLAPMHAIVEQYLELDQKRAAAEVTCEYAAAAEARGALPLAADLYDQAISRAPSPAIQKNSIRVLTQLKDRARLLPPLLRFHEESLRASRYAEAEQQLTAALEAFPGDMILLEKLADLYLADSREEEARAVLLEIGASPEADLELRVRAVEQALELDIADYDSMLYLATLHEERGDLQRAATACQQAAESMLADGQTEGALAAIERAARLVPDDPRLSELAGEMALRQGNTERACELFEQYTESLARAHAAEQLKEAWPRVIGRMPGSERLRRAYVNHLVADGRLAEAAVQLVELAELHRGDMTGDALESLYRQALSFDDLQPTALRRLGEASLAAGDREEGAAQLRRARDSAAHHTDLAGAVLAAQPLAAEGLLDADEQFQLALWLQSLKRNAEALQLLRKLEQDSSSTIDRLALLESLFALGEQNLPLQVELAGLLERIGRKEEAAVAVAGVARELRALGQNDQAVSLLKQAAALAPDRLETRLELVWLLIREEDWPEALEAAPSVIEGLLERGDGKEALGLATRLLKEKPGRAALVWQQARAHLILASTDEARDALDTVIPLFEAKGELGLAIEAAKLRLSLNVADTDLREQLALLLVKDGARDAARDEYHAIVRQLAGAQAALLPPILRTLEALDATAWEDYKRTLDFLAGLSISARDSVERFAAAAEDRGRQDLALAAFDFLLAGSPEDGELLRARGRLLVHLGRAAEAEECYGRMVAAVRETPRALPLAREALAVLPGSEGLRRLLFEVALTAGEIDEAAQLGGKLIHDWREKDRFDEAIILSEVLLEVLSDEAAVSIRHAELLLEVGRGEEAVAILREFARQQEQPAPGEARKALEALLHHFPDSARDTIQLHRLAVRLDGLRNGRPLLDQALTLLDREAHSAENFREEADQLLALDPENYELKLRVLELWAGRGKGAEACEEAVAIAERTAVQGTPRLGVPFVRAAVVWRTDLPMRERVARFMEDAGEGDEAAEAWHVIAGKRRDRGEYQEEAEALREVVRLQPANLEVHSELTALLLSRAELLSAEDRFAALSAFGIRALAVGQPTNSLDALRAACALKPDNLETTDHLIEALLLADRKEEALERRLRLLERLGAEDQPDEARPRAEAALSDHPNSTELLTIVTRLRLQAGDFPGYSDAIARQLALLLAENRSGEAAQFLGLGAEELLKATEFRLAEVLLRGQAELVRDVPDLCRQRALSLEGLGDTMGSAAAWADLGRLHAEGDNPEAAATAFGRALVLDPVALPHHRALIDLLRGQPEQQDAFVQALRGYAALLAKNKNDDEALAIHAEILRLAPNSIESLRAAATHSEALGQEEEGRALRLRLGAALFEDGEYAQADATYTELLERDPLDAVALLGLLSVLEKTRQLMRHLEAARRLAKSFDKQQLLEDANGIYERIAALHPLDLESRERLAGYHAQAGNHTQAAQFYRELGGLAVERGALDKAADALNQAEKIEPRHPQTLEIFASLYEKLQDAALSSQYLIDAARRYAELGREADALAATERLLQRDPYHPESRELRSQLFEQRGNAAAALKELELLTHLYQSSELPLREIEVLERVLRLDPKADKQRHRCARLLGENDRETEAVEHLLTIARQQNESGDRLDAIDTVDAALALLPDQAECHQLAFSLACEEDLEEGVVEHALWLAAFHEEEERSAEAAEILLKARHHTRQVIVHRRAAEALLNAHRKEEARSVFQEASALLESAPSRSEWRHINEGLFRLDPLNRDALAKVVGAARDAGEVPNAVTMVLACTDAMLENADIDEARQVVRQYDALLGPEARLSLGAATLFEKHSLPEIASTELVTFARWLHAQGTSLEEGLALVERALVLKPGDLAGLQLRVFLLVDLGRSREAIDDAVIVIDLLGSRDLAEPALELGEQLVTLHPTHVPLRSRLARLYSMRGESSKQAMQLRQIALLQIEDGQLEEAAGTLRILLDIRPEDTRARLSFIELTLQSGSEADLSRDYLALASVYGKKGAYAEASKAWEKAIELRPEDLAIVEEYVQFLRENSIARKSVEWTRLLAARLIEKRQGRRALELLQAGPSTGPNDGEYHELLGRAQFVQNSKGMAMRELREAASFYRSAGRPSDTARVLEDLLSIDSFNLEIRQELIECRLRAGQQTEALIAMEELAERYLERGLCDLADTELRRLLALDQDRPEAWKALFRAGEMLGHGTQLSADYTEYAEMLARRGEIYPSLEYYRKAMDLDSSNLRAHRGFVTQYPKIGRHHDIVDRILAYAQLLVEAGDIDDATKYFDLVMQIDPTNTLARDMMSQTQSRPSLPDPPPRNADHHSRSRVDNHLPITPNPDPTSSTGWKRLTESQRRVVVERTASASDYLTGTLDRLDQEENNNALAQAVANYRTILAANSQNAAMRLKLADVYQQMGRLPDMLEELGLAAETLLSRGELPQCVQVCERYLAMNPNDARMRRRLNEAVIKRDAMRALESSISYVEDLHDGPSTRPEAR